MISIIMPTFNHHSYIKESVDSILSQDGIEFELIIVPVKEDSQTIDIIRSYSDSRIKIVYSNYALITHQMNLGYFSASDKSDYIMLFASDDVMIKGALPDIYNFAIRKKAVVAYPNYYIVNNILTDKRLIRLDDHNHNELIKNCYITDISLVKKSIFYKHLPMKFMDARNRIWKIWKNISKDYGQYFFNYAEPFFLYRQHKTNVHSRQKSQGKYEPLVIGYKDELISFYKSINRSKKIAFFNSTIYFPDPSDFLSFGYEKLKFKRLIVHWTENCIGKFSDLSSYDNIYNISHNADVIEYLKGRGMQNVVFVHNENDFYDYIYQDRYII